MASYVSQSACRGRRPAHLSNRRHYRRPYLIARLVRERSVARFIVAPDGFGKSGAAMEYAETLFEFAGCYWFRCDSPCFIRDLDANTLVCSVFEIDNPPKLVVFDDVPPLSAERAAQLSLVIDTFIDVGSEVLVTCAPSADAFSQLQRDRLKVGAHELLLADDEIDALRTPEERLERDVRSMLACERIVSLAWGNAESSGARFLRGIAREELPAQMTLALLTLLVLGSGPLSLLEEVAAFDNEVIGLIERCYPYVGVDRFTGTFKAPRFEIEDIAAAFRPRIETAAERSRFSDRDRLALAWADMLLARGDAARACETARRLSSQNPRLNWVLEHDEELLERACVFPSLELFDSLGQPPGKRLAVSLALARRYVLLGDEQAAVSQAKRIAFDRSVPEFPRMQALVMLARHASDKLEERAVKEIDALLEEAGCAEDDPSELEGCDVRLCGAPDQGEPGQGAPSPEDATARPHPYTRDERAWIPLALIFRACARTPGAGIAAWVHAWLRGAEADVLMTSAAWIFESFAEGATPHAHADWEMTASDVASTFNAGIVVRFVTMRLAAENKQRLGLADAVTALALVRARAGSLPMTGEALSPDIMLWLHDVEMSLRAQRKSYEDGKRKRYARRADKVATHPDAYLNAADGGKAAFAKGAPQLDVKLFGGMEVTLQGERIDISRASRA